MSLPSFLCSFLGCRVALADRKKAALTGNDKNGWLSIPEFLFRLPRRATSRAANCSLSGNNKKADLLAFVSMFFSRLPRRATSRADSSRATTKRAGYLSLCSFVGCRIPLQAGLLRRPSSRETTKRADLLSLCFFLGCRIPLQAGLQTDRSWEITKRLISLPSCLCSFLGCRIPLQAGLQADRSAVLGKRQKGLIFYLCVPF